jgi:DNA-binding transcriptional regulator LsrR (DeoR family)
MVATLYYKQNLSQQEIAKKLKMSRPTVSRILSSCIEDGIVTIQIKSVASHQYELAKQVKVKFNLTYVSVVSNHTDREQILASIGRTAAAYLNEYINQDTRLGISAGNTIAHIIKYLNPIHKYKMDVFQMQGDASHQMDSCSSFLSAEIARALNARVHAMHVPLLVNTKVLRDLLLEEPFNKKHFEQLSNLDAAIVGLGLIDSILPSTSDNWYTIEQDKQLLKSLNVVGDICGNFIDADGNLTTADIRNHTIAISLEQLRTCKNCIAVACGNEKTKVVLAAIKGGWFHLSL